MTSAAAATRADDAGARTLSDRFVGALPLLTLYVWLLLVYVWQAWLTPTPSIFPDELQYAELGRSIAETGEPAIRGVDAGFATLPAYLTAPAWLAGDVGDAYLTAKSIGVVAMAAVVFPAYALARLVAPRGPALWAAAGVGLAPALSYSALLMEEPYAYTAATLAFWLVVRAAVRPTRAAVALAVAASLAAPLVRSQLVLVTLAGAVAAAAVAVRTARVRALRRRAGRRGAALAAAGGAILLVTGHLVLRDASDVWRAATAAPGDTLDYAVWSLGALTLGLAVVPVVAALAVAAGTRRDADPAWRALVALLASGVVLFPLYAGAKVAFLAPAWTAPVEERNVIYLVPLVFAAAARWLAERRVPLAAVGAAGLATLALLRLTPTILSLPYFEAPGFALLAGLHQDAGLGAEAARNAELLLLAVSVAVVCVAGLRPWGRRVAFAAVAAVLVALFAGELWASAEQRRLAGQIRDESAQPLTWLDDVAGERPVAFVGRELRNVNGLWTLEFWNESLRDVVVLGGFPPPPGEGVAVNVTGADGAVGPDPGAPLVVTDSELVPTGTLLAEHGRWRVYTAERPLRLREDVEGVEPDGWAGALASYTRFSPASGQLLEVTVGRTAWTARSPRSTVTVRVGPVAIGAGGGAYLGGLSTQRDGTVGSGETTVFRIPAPDGPFRAEVAIAPTFVPAEVDPTSTDARSLGAQVSFRLVAAG